MYKKVLLDAAWNTAVYTKTSYNLEINPALVKLREYSKNKKNILDLGCADGKILWQIYRKDANFTGIDISERSIRIAKQKFLKKKNVKFFKEDLESLKIYKKRFDLIYSTYTLEHLDNPEMMLLTATDLLESGGMLILICPNYGSPVEYSPGSPMVGETLGWRAVKQFVNSWRPYKALEWRKVRPPILDTHQYVSDADVTIEPYLGTLVKFLERIGMKTVEAESGIEKIEYGKNILGFIKYFSLMLGKMNIWPFKYYGPRLFYAGVKE